LRWGLWLALLLSGGAVAAGLAGLDAAVTREEVEERMRNVERQIRAAPKQAGLYVERGNAYFQLREFDLAIDDFTTALKLDDRQDDAYFGRGMALARNGQVDAGIADLSVYLARHPDSSVAYTKRGVRYLWKGDRENAEKDLARAVTLDARNAEAHDDLGVIHAQRGDYARAGEHFQTTIRLDPTYQKAHHNLAMVYYLTGRHAAALAAVNRSLELRASARGSLLLKGEILAALGRHEEARRVRQDAEFLPEENWSERAPVQ
jgi:tetratricopeptide (TPR) repeat protein